MQIIRKSLGYICSFAVLLGILGLVNLCGCNGTDRQGVSGTVTLDGQPLGSGSITFLPTDKSSTAGSPGGVIKDGAFDIPAKAGPLPGKYKAVIQAMKETGKEVEGPGGTTLSESVPVSIVESAGIDVEVTTSGPNTLNIQVTSQAK
jgi:hypothetical protein